MKHLIIAALMLMLYSCSLTVNQNLRKIGKDNITANLDLPDDDGLYDPYFDSLMNRQSSDTLTIFDNEGRKVHLMKAVMDSTGTLVSTEMLNPAIITARFKNVAERHGEVCIAFEVRIPWRLMNREWQLRMKPKAVVLEDTLALDSIIVTGDRFREKQLRGYELYEKFLSGIITDSSELVHTHLLEIFISRNIPELAAMKKDSSFVVDNTARGLFGVTYTDARNYFKRSMLIAKNNRRQEMAPAKYAKFVTTPFIDEGIRVDTVMTEYGKELVYNYVERIKTRPGLRKIDISVGGSIHCDGEEKYRIPPSKELTFYVASFATMAEQNERFITKVIERKAVSNISARIGFHPGEYSIDETLGSNEMELEKLKHSIAELVENKEFNIDSLVITASCSPEGSYATNINLSALRGEELVRYFQNFVNEYKAKADSADLEKYGYLLDESGFGGTGFTGGSERITDFEFAVQSIPEDWERLMELITLDTAIKDKQGILALCRNENPEIRERELSRHAEYSYVIENIYPQLRNVRFDFHLHRKGMIKDTIHTTVPDTVYYMGLKAIRERDYKSAVKYLGQYKDINSALAYLAMDYNASAMNVLESLPPSGKRDYLLAIAHSRGGNEQQAVQYFINSVGFDPSMAFRGNLDPEISSLIKKYNIGLEQ